MASDEATTREGERLCADAKEDYGGDDARTATVKERHGNDDDAKAAVARTNEEASSDDQKIYARHYTWSYKPSLKTEEVQETSGFYQADRSGY